MKLSKKSLRSVSSAKTPSFRSEICPLCSVSYLVASFLESPTKGDEGLDVAAATDGKDGDVHGRLLTLVDGRLLKLNEIR
jgi:hypothetical protein